MARPHLGPRPEMVDLDRTEVRRVADRLDVARGAGEDRLSVEVLAARIGIGRQRVGLLCNRPAAARVSVPDLDGIAAYFELDRAELLSGKARAA